MGFTVLEENDKKTEAYKLTYRHKLTYMKKKKTHTHIHTHTHKQSHTDTHINAHHTLTTCLSSSEPTLLASPTHDLTGLDPG